MPTATDIPGAVFKQGSVVLMARVVGVDGQPIVAADINSIVYSILELDPCLPDSATAVTGHADVNLTVGDVIADALEVSALWTVDVVGHNFLHVIDVSQNEAFPKAGVDYQVRYELQPTAGQKIVLRYRLRSV